MGEKKKPLIRWTLPMKRVLFALIPAVIGSLYFFGWRSLLLIVCTAAAAFIAEYLFARHYGDSVDSSVFVTAALLALSLPPALPIWMAVIGAVFAIVFGKMVFGGFGKNVFNPAMTGRAFIYITFAHYMTAMWSEPFSGAFGGFTAWSADALSGATPLAQEGGSYVASFLGTIPGCMGETSALLLLAGGLFLYVKKVLNRVIVHSLLISFIVTQTGLYFGGFSLLDPLSAALSGGFVMGLFFIATDPVSAPKKKQAQYFYGIFIGVMTCVIRTFSLWPEGFMFAILLANMCAPLADKAAAAWLTRKKLKAGGAV